MVQSYQPSDMFCCILRPTQSVNDHDGGSNMHEKRSSAAKQIIDI